MVLLQICSWSICYDIRRLSWFKWNNTLESTFMHCLTLGLIGMPAKWARLLCLHCLVLLTNQSFWSLLRNLKNKLEFELHWSCQKQKYFSCARAIWLVKSSSDLDGVSYCLTYSGSVSAPPHEHLMSNSLCLVQNWALTCWVSQLHVLICNDPPLIHSQTLLLTGVCCNTFH